MKKKISKHKKKLKKESKSKKEPIKPKQRKANMKVIGYSILGIGFLALTYFVDWLFIIGAVVMVWLNQKELNKKCCK